MKECLTLFSSGDTPALGAGESYGAQMKDFPSPSTQLSRSSLAGALSLTPRTGGLDKIRYERAGVYRSVGIEIEY